MFIRPKGEESGAAKREKEMGWLVEGKQHSLCRCVGAGWKQRRRINCAIRISLSLSLFRFERCYAASLSQPHISSLPWTYPHVFHLFPPHWFPTNAHMGLAFYVDVPSLLYVCARLDAASRFPYSFISMSYSFHYYTTTTTILLLCIWAVTSISPVFIRCLLLFHRYSSIPPFSSSILPASSVNIFISVGFFFFFFFIWWWLRGILFFLFFFFPFWFRLGW